ncbi:MAG: hypothetical protein ACLGXA_14920 [Acidobacteriota bacterium]
MFAAVGVSISPEPDQKHPGDGPDEAGIHEGKQNSARRSKIIVLVVIEVTIFDLCYLPT